MNDEKQESYPTAWAYEQACKALEKWRTIAKTLAEAVERGLEERPTCPFCYQDLRPQFDCKSCEVDHMGSECFHDGEHAPDCIGVKAMIAYRESLNKSSSPRLGVLRGVIFDHEGFKAATEKRWKTSTRADHMRCTKHQTFFKPEGDEDDPNVEPCWACAEEFQKEIVRENKKVAPETQGKPCPRRSREHGPWDSEQHDGWVANRWEGENAVWQLDWFPRSCNFCGSVHPEDAFQLLDQGWEIDLTSKRYKFYINPPGTAQRLEVLLEKTRTMGADAFKETPSVWSPTPPVKCYTMHLTQEQIIMVNKTLCKQRGVEYRGKEEDSNAEEDNPAQSE